MVAHCILPIETEGTVGEETLGLRLISQLKKQ